MDQLTNEAHPCYEGGEAVLFDMQDVFAAEQFLSNKNISKFFETVRNDEFLKLNVDNTSTDACYVNQSTMNNIKEGHFNLFIINMCLITQ